jgi:hypothetical protein
VKTLESKETEAQRNETVTHNSVFAAAHRQMPNDDCKIDIRHFLFWIEPSIAPMRSGRRGVLTIANVPVLEKYDGVVVEPKRVFRDWR